LDDSGKKSFNEISKDRDERIRQFLKKGFEKSSEPIDATRVRKSLCPICGYPVFLDEVMIILPPEEDGMYAHEKCYKKYGRKDTFWWIYATPNRKPDHMRRSHTDYFEDLEEEMERRGIKKRCKICLLRVHVNLNGYNTRAQEPVYMEDGTWAHQGCAEGDESIRTFTLLETGMGTIKAPSVPDCPKCGFPMVEDHWCPTGRR